LRIAPGFPGSLFAVLLGGLVVLLQPLVARAQLYTDTQTLFGDPNTAEYFGYYVAASGDTLVVSTSSNKRIYVYVHTPAGWVLQQKIAANYSDQSFGRIAIDGDTLVAGNEIYVRSGGVWTLQQALPFGGDPRPAVQGDTVVIGVPRASNGDANGSVYVFTRSGTKWTQQALLFPDTPGQVQMGVQVRIDRGTIVAATQNGSFGAAFGAYVFTGSGATWTQQAKLVSPTGGWWMSVAIDGDTIALSDPPNNRIYMFARSGTSWSITDTIPIPMTGGNYFGDQLALSGGILAASADGMFYVLSKTSSGWIDAQSFPRSGDAFGSLDLTRHGKTFVLSNPYDNTQAYANGIVEVFTVPPPPPPGSGWHDVDVGATGVAGGSADNNGTVTVRGSGADIWDQADQFHFRTATLAGDGAIIAHVTSSGTGNPWSKIGLMFREDLAPASREVTAFVTPGNHLGVQFRADTADTSVFQEAGWVEAPLWLMLARSGDTFAGYRSDDGNAWTPIGSTTALMPQTIHVGLAVSSHDNATLNTGTFAAVEIVPTGPPSPDGPNPPSNLGGNLAGNINVRLQWTDNSGDETGFAIERALGNANGAYYPVASVGANTTEYTDWGLAANTTYSYRVRSVRNDVTSVPSNTFTITTLSQPSGTLSGQDIGDVTVPGSYSSTNGVMTINAAGTDIWDQADSFFFIHLEISGDFDIRARVTALGDTNPWAKAGVMIRESLDPQSPNVCTLLTADNAAGMQSRDSFGATTTFTAGPWVHAPCWTRLVRRGDTFESLISEDGVNWTTIATRTVAMAATVHAGVAVTSHAPATTTQATVSALLFNGAPF
jgi:regulation of enolase protein 1 (concanavalin A-like superfamily)